MSPAKSISPSSRPVERTLARLALDVGTSVRDERTRRRLPLRELAARAHLSPSAVHAVETGRPASLDTYVRLSAGLGLTLELVLQSRRRAVLSTSPSRDIVHAAMGELELARLGPRGYGTGVDEPYQHYQFAGRADVLAWSVEDRALLHIENRTRFPDLQEVAGAWNAKRTYLTQALAERLGVRRWDSVAHVMVVLWSAEALHTLRLRTSTFRSLCPDHPDDFEAWWSGSPRAGRHSAALVVLDPCATGRQRLYCGLADALRAKPRYRGYAEAAECLRVTGR